MLCGHIGRVIYRTVVARKFSLFCDTDDPSRSFSLVGIVEDAMRTSILFAALLIVGHAYAGSGNDLDKDVTNTTDVTTSENATDVSSEVAATQENLNTLLLAVGTPECVKPCVKGLIRVSALPPIYNDTVANANRLCDEYRKAKACVSKTMCRSKSAFDVATKGVQYLCVETISLVKVVAPCLNKNSEQVLKGCEKSCSLDQAFTELAEHEEVQKLAKEGGDPLEVLDLLGGVCPNLLCFLSCAQKGLNARCPFTGTAFVDSSIRPMEYIAQHLGTSSRAAMDAIKDRVPEECHPFLDVGYLNSLKLFGALPPEKASHARSHSDNCTHRL